MEADDDDVAGTAEALRLNKLADAGYKVNPELVRNSIRREMDRLRESVESQNALLARLREMKRG